MAERHEYYMLYRYCLYFSTSFIMNFVALNDDVKFIISKHLASDLKIRQVLSKNHDLQYIHAYIHTYIHVLKRNESDWLRCNGTPEAVKCASVSRWACRKEDAKIRRALSPHCHHFIAMTVGAGKWHCQKWHCHHFHLRVEVVTMPGRKEML